MSTPTLKAWRATAGEPPPGTSGLKLPKILDQK